MAKFVPYEKLSKKKKKMVDKIKRGEMGFNTGTRIHQTDKHPSRARQKELSRSLED